MGLKFGGAESRAEGTYIKKEDFVHRTASTCSAILTTTELMGFCYNEQKQEEQEWSSQKKKQDRRGKEKQEAGGRKAEQGKGKLKRKKQAEVGDRMMIEEEC